MPSNRKVGVIQSNYIPWKGYFDIINRCDEFILYDDCQYTKNDWRNRNQIKTPQGLMWLTIPVLTKNRFGGKIKDMEIADSSWANNHWRTIQQFYKKAPCYSQVAPFLEELYQRAADEPLLSRVNALFLRRMCQFVGIPATIVTSMDYDLPDTGSTTERLIHLIQKAGGDIYYSGPSARNYLDMAAFTESGIQLEWVDYDDYEPYPQLHGPFVHAVSFLDAILNTGPLARSYLKSYIPDLTGQRSKSVLSQELSL